MTNFDIIGALRTYATGLGMAFVWQKDEFYANFESQQAYAPGQLIMVADLRPTPEVRGASIGDIVYNGLLMIGRKFDTTGIASSLDEDALQKYDRRLLELTTLLITHASTFACNNNLLLQVGQIDYLFNAFDANIDFVAAQNIQFTQ